MKIDGLPFKQGIDYWRCDTAQKGAFLIDGDNYFSDLAYYASKAEYEIIIIGWDFDTRIKFPSPMGKEKESSLGEFLIELTRKKKNLHIYILVWDAIPFYAAGRQATHEIKQYFAANNRITFCSDAQHPFAASQHEKLIIIDRWTAYCGGFDLTIGRWDTSAHKLSNTAAFHDLMVRLHGDCVFSLTQLAENRWKKATNQNLFNRGIHPIPLPENEIHEDFVDMKCLISRTIPKNVLQKEVREIESLYLKLIRTAKKLVYIENQYFASRLIATELARSLQKKSGPHIIIILTPNHEGWFEDHTMGGLRNKLINLLYKADVHKRLGVFFPFVPGNRQGFTLHSKLMIVDHNYAMIGSANLNNRSMGLDSECNITLLAESDKNQAVIKMLLLRLLSEHLGMSVTSIKKQIRKNYDLLTIIKKRRRSARNGRCLHGYRTRANDWIRDLMMDIKIFDPPHAFDAQIEFDQIMVSLWQKNIKRFVIWSQLFGLSISASVIGAFFVSPTFPLEVNFLDLSYGNIAPDFARVSSTLSFIAISNILLIPIMYQIIMISLIVKGIEAYILSILLVFISCIFSYISGKIVGRKLLSRLLFKNINYIIARLGSSGLRPIIYTRLIVWLPFSLINLIAGSGNIGLYRLIIGSVLGTLPSLIIVVTLTHQLRDFFDNFSAKPIVISTLCVFLSWLWLYFLRRRFKHLSLNQHKIDIY